MRARTSCAATWICARRAVATFAPSIAWSRRWACDLVIVETDDAVLVADKSRSQEVKEVVETLARQARTEHVSHSRVYRPWGYYEGIDAGERFQVKRIMVKPGEALSLQMHHHRAEHWVVVSGTARVTRGDEVKLLSENESTEIPIARKHRLDNVCRVRLVRL